MADNKEKNIPDIQMSRTNKGGVNKEAVVKVESILRGMYNGKRDCFLILTPDTTLEELEKGENLRPLITPLEQANPMPVIRVFTGEMIAEQTAETFGCVKDGKALVAQVPFERLFGLLNNLTKTGIFFYVINEAGKNYVDKVSHMGEYIYKEMMHKDPKPYLDFNDVVESVHRIRMNGGKFYVVLPSDATPDQVDRRIFTLGFVGSQEAPVCPVFERKEIGTIALRNWGVNAQLEEVTSKELYEKIVMIIKSNGNKDFPIMFGDVKAGHPVSGSHFAGLLLEMFARPTPAPKAEGEETEEAVEGAPMVEEVPIEEVPTEETPATEE